MAFDANQPAYKEFRDILKQRIHPVIVWSGAGLSQPAGLPTWTQLREKLLKSAKNQLPILGGPEAKRFEGLIQAAENTRNLWEAFNLLKQAFRGTSFASEIRANLGTAENAAPPKAYEELWQLGIRGILSSNLDRLAARAFTSVHPGRNLAEFQGFDARYQADILRGGTQFVVNLHGVLNVEPSWVFTPNDFEALLRTPGFKDFITTCFCASTVLFLGISADDMAAGGHLARLKEQGLSLKGHYWLTNRADGETSEWAERAGIRQIIYSAPEGSHGELNDFLRDLRKYIPQDDPVFPIVPSTRRERHVNILPPEDIERLSAEEIRQALNKEAIRILGSSSPTRIQEYQTFWDNYSEAIHRAWSVSCKPNRNRFFDYELIAPLARGAFGQVYQAKDSTGKKVALKILHGDIKEEPELLQGFRRGVRAMEILSNKKIEGMIPYLAKWEIPASTVMEFIEGANLQEAIEWGWIESWKDILLIISSLVDIIKKAHGVHEHVLHRDIRPPNIMLRNPEAGKSNWEIVVLDFDLSWHKDATEVSIDVKHTANGYMAPEQTSTSQKNLTRNALVDSFGIGMTLYFLITKTHPLFGQQRHGNWTTILKDKIAGKKCIEWVSLPQRLARLIEWATKDDQILRWDVTRIKGELDRLTDCITNRAPIRSCELLTEEIASRCPDMNGFYEWSVDKNSATTVLRSGFTVSLMADESNQIVRLTIDWSNAGDKSFENVRKFIGVASDKCCSALKAGGWKVSQKDRSISSGSSRIVSHLPTSPTLALPTIEKLAKSLSHGIQALRLS